MPRKRVKKLNPGKPLGFRPLPGEILRMLRRIKLIDSPLGFDTPCWIWKGCTDDNGYGSIKVRGRRVWVHRFSFEVFNRPPPAGHEVDHLCHNSSCINPAHLGLETHAGNSKQKARHASVRKLRDRSREMREPIPI